MKNILETRSGRIVAVSTVLSLGTIGCGKNETRRTDVPKCNTAPNISDVNAFGPSKMGGYNAASVDRCIPLHDNEGKYIGAIAAHHAFRFNCATVKPESVTLTLNSEGLGTYQEVYLSKAKNERTDLDDLQSVPDCKTGDPILAE